jgi:putative protease
VVNTKRTREQYRDSTFRWASSGPSGDRERSRGDALPCWTYTTCNTTAGLDSAVQYCYFGTTGLSEEVVMAEQLVGIVTHFFKGPGVAVVKVSDEGHITVGDQLHFVGHTTDFTETVDSMEVEHQKVEKAAAGDEIAIKVVDRARQHDQVFKVV